MLDLVIIGGSTAGTAAAIYAARRGLKFKIVTKDFNGELATSGEIGNWPGIPKTDGIELAQKFREHLEYLKVSIDEGIEVEKIAKANGSFCITAKEDGTTKAMDKVEHKENGALRCDYEAKAVLIATGAHPRELKVAGEKKFRNRGVSYCTTCDGPLFTGKRTATIGGGNSALESALMLADIAEHVTVINKNPEFKGDAVLIENLKARKNVDIIYHALTSEIMGKDFVTSLRYNDQELALDGIFVHIGMIPNSSMVPNDVKKNEFGEIIVNAAGETNIPGLYAAGDVTSMQFKQNPIAAGQAVAALLSAVSYLNRL